MTKTEIFYAAAFCFVVALVVVDIASNGSWRDNENSISFGVNGFVETRCIDGLKFTIGEGGQARQIMDAQGKGVACGQGGAE